MSDFSFDALVCFVFIAGTITIALTSYGIGRLVFVRRIENHTQDLAGSVTFRVAALHALILGLVFAHETANIAQIKDGLTSEATAVADIFYDLDRYDAAGSQEMRVIAAQYARSVVEQDWPELHRSRHLFEGSYIQWEALYQHVLNLVPETPRHEALRTHMLEKVHRIADLRQARVNAANSSIPWLFWLAATGGVVFVCVPYFIFPPRPLSIALISVFSAYTGLVLFVIFAFSDPFSAPGAVPPTPFVDLLNGEIGRWADGLPDGI